MGYRRASTFTPVDRKSNGLQRNSEVVNPQKTWESHPKVGFPPETQRQMSGESPVDSHTSEQNRDIVTPANTTRHTVPEILTGWPLQPREQDSGNDEFQDLSLHSLRLPTTLPLQTTLTVLLKYWSA